MPHWYLTPSSIGYLTQFILSLSLTAYFMYRIHTGGGKSAQAYLLGGFFIAVTAFVGLLFLDAASLTTARLYFLFLENPILGVVLVLLLQFAYHFPSSFPSRRGIASLALILSVGYALYEAQFATYRYDLLLRYGNVEYRPPAADVVLALFFIWVLLAFLAQAVAADQRSDARWWAKVLNPQGVGARGAYLFALILIPLFALTVINLLQAFAFVSDATYSASISLGILVTLFLFAYVFFNYQPGVTSFLIKLSGLSLTLLLVALGLVGWVVSPAYAAAYRPSLEDHQTLRYTPNDLGGYDIARIPFHFEQDLGQRVMPESPNQTITRLVDFDFPLYGRSYDQVAVTSTGLLRMGQSLHHPNLENNYGHMAGIFALLVDLDPASGGLFAKVEDDRLVVTWDRMQGWYQPGAVYTFQTILYADGRFDVTYNGLPDTFLYEADASPFAVPWVRGVTPGGGDPVETVADLSRPLRSGPHGMVQDFHIDFRTFLSRLLAPLAWLVLIGSLVLLVSLPALVDANVVRPLQVLLVGAGRVENGDLTVEMPIRYNDEIGSLTASFNAMVAQLRGHVSGLEERVWRRTQELEQANERLLIEIDERKAAEGQLIQQQRELAAAEEREQIGRGLNDGFGQVIGFVNTQAQSAQSLLERNQVGAAQETLARIVETAQQARLNLRHHILGMREPMRVQRSFYGILQESLQAFSQAWGVEAIFSPSQNTLPVLTEAVEDQLLHIIQEALVNIRKHASARRVEVLITSLANEVVFIVSDDGRGFDPQSAPGVGEKRFGLNIMRERAEQVGGRLEVRSAVGQGTRVLIHVPHVLAAEPQTDRQADIKSLRILLVDDQPLFLEGMRGLLLSRGLTVVGLARDGLDACDQVRHLRPDVVVMDIQMPRCDGIEATRRIKAGFPEVRVVLMTVAEDEDILLDAMKYGASGYLPKGLDANHLFTQLGAALRGENPITPDMAARMLAEFNQTAAAPRKASFRAESVPGELTMRQWEVLRLVARGLTYKEVGSELSLTERAIKYHMAQITERLNLKNREQVVAYVRQFQEDRRRKAP